MVWGSATPCGHSVYYNINLFKENLLTLCSLLEEKPSDILDKLELFRTNLRPKMRIFSFPVERSRESSLRRQTQRRPTLLTRLELLRAKYNGVTIDSENKDKDTFLFLSGHRQGAAGQFPSWTTVLLSMAKDY